MPTLNEIYEQDRRLGILRLLLEASGYTLNDRMLRVSLQQYGHNVSLDVVRASLAWLKDIGAIALDVQMPQGNEIHVATIQRPGLEHVEGARVIPGIKRPGPG